MEPDVFQMMIEPVLAQRFINTARTVLTVVLLAPTPISMTVCPSVLMELLQTVPTVKNKHQPVIQISILVLITPVTIIQPALNHSILGRIINVMIIPQLTVVLMIVVMITTAPVLTPTITPVWMPVQSTCSAMAWRALTVVKEVLDTTAPV